MMLLVSLGAVVAAASADTGPVAIRVIGPWVVEVGEADPVRLEIEPPPVVAIENEEHGSPPVFDPKAGGWRKGARLGALIAEECTATGLLEPESFRVKPSPNSPTPFVLGKDYDMDPFWGTFGRIDGGAIPADQPVFVDYVYSPCRLDSVVRDGAGAIRLVQGTPGVAVILPPVVKEGETVLLNVWVPGRTEQLTDENLYPIDFDLAPLDVEPVAEKLLPKTLGKLRAGEEVTIIAWGDSVTNGGGVGSRTEEWYQNVFGKRLQERFPEATVTMRTAAWGGRSSRAYLEAPAGGEKDFVRDVLDPKPDLVTIEFVNDAYLNEEATQAHYAGILEKLEGVGAEVILITPHFVRPDWMGVNTMKLDEDPRPYVRGLRRFAAEHNLAVADASARWRRLWRQGIPYITLEANWINHPDARGHEIFAEALLALFPEK